MRSNAPGRAPLGSGWRWVAERLTRRSFRPAHPAPCPRQRHRDWAVRRLGSRAQPNATASTSATSGWPPAASRRAGPSWTSWSALSSRPARFRTQWRRGGGCLPNTILLAAMPVFFLSTGLRTQWDVGGAAVFAATLSLLLASVAGELAGVRADDVERGTGAERDLAHREPRPRRARAPAARLGPDPRLSTPQ